MTKGNNICLTLLYEEAFITVLFVDIFGWFVSIMTGVIVFTFIGDGLLKTLFVFVVARIVYSLVIYTFIEPYETAALITTFYNVMYEEEETVDLEPVKRKLINASVPFKKLVSKALGQEESAEESSTLVTGTILDENLLDIATRNLTDLIREESTDDRI